MKIKFIQFLIIFYSGNIFAQLGSFGLEGRIINDLKAYNQTLYAATDSGVYQRNVTIDTVWTFMGLENKNVTAIYPHISGGGPGFLVITAGIAPKFTAGDSVLIYCSCSPGEDNIWTPADSGINRDSVSSISTIDGFPSPAVCGETFAGAGGKLFLRKFTETWYEKIFDIGAGHLNVVKSDLKTGNTWIGGETGFFSPYISKSTNKGQSWITFFPNLGGDNACNSIQFELRDTNIIYAGMEGLVIKSTDGGVSWNPTGLINTPYYFYGLAEDGDFLYAGGSTSTYDLGLYWSTNKGSTWDSLPIVDSRPYKGIISMVLVDLGLRPNKTQLFAGTYGDGVLSFNIPIVGVEKRSELKNEFDLGQNYPNPFNPVTYIEFNIPNIQGLRQDLRFMSLKVYDILGNEVAVLVNEKKSPGIYKVEFNASGLSSGVYFYQLKGDSFIQTKKMILMR